MHGICLSFMLHVAFKSINNYKVHGLYIYIAIYRSSDHAEMGQGFNHAICAGVYKLILCLCYIKFNSLQAHSVL